MTSPNAAVLIPLLLLLAPAARTQDVAYEKYTLDNGMTVILHEDRSLPQVNVNIWYRVGGKDEPRGRSGFAHLFEHLMFMGTERVPGSEFDLIMEAGGGFNNASTSFDRTNYYDNGPSELLSSLLWLEADRLEALGENMTQEKLDKQRDVVRNERRQNYENQPYGEAQLMRLGLLYPEGHPYHIPVIGTHADLEAATVADVKRFFADYYVPNNAALVVAGDFDPAVVRPLIERLFGSLPRGAEAEHRTAGPVRLEEDVHAQVSDAVQFAQTTLYWHSPPFFAPGDAEMDLIAAILSDGISSRLYQALVVERPLAVEVEAYQESRMLGSTFAISALARPGVALDEVERAIDEVLARFASEGPSAAELERQQARNEAAILQRLQSIQSKSDRLNMYEMYFGEPNSFARDLDRYREATREGVQTFARSVLTDAKRVRLHVLPETDAVAVNPRDERPAPLAEGAFAPPAPEHFELACGVPVQFWQRSELPLVEVAVVLPVGSAQDPAGKGGLAYLAAGMLDEGAGERGAVAFADDLERLGASVAIDVDQEWTELRLTALQRNFGPSLDLLADMLLRPTFDKEEWKRVHELHGSGLRQELDSPTSVARAVSLRAFFGDEHPYGRPVKGTLASVAEIRQGDAVRFFVDHFGPKGATLLVAGDLTREEAVASLERAFGEWNGLLERRGREASAAGPPGAGRSGFRALVVDRPGAVQTVVRFMLPAPAFTDPTRPARQLLTTVLGGTFTSRLNQNLREDKGYTYGARAGLVFGTSASYLTAFSSVRVDVTGASLKEFLAELANLRAGGVSEAEAAKARASVRLRTIQGFAGLSGVLDAASERVRAGLAFDSLGRELEAVARIGVEDLNELAPRSSPLDRAVLVLVGDEARIREQLGGLGLPELESVDVTGDPVTAEGEAAGDSGDEREGD